MVAHVLVYQLLLVALVVICLGIQVWWPDPPRATSYRPLEPNQGRRKRAKEPTAFPGLIHKPRYETCA